MHARIHNPPTAPTPASAYAQGISIADTTRWMLVSGQVGMSADGALADSVDEQMRQCFRNIFAVLEDADMTRQNIVKLTVFLVDSTDVPAYRGIRDEMMQGHVAGSTLLVIDALAHPDWRVEIEATACA